MDLSDYIKPDILEQNKEFFLQVYRDGFKQKGFGVLFIDTDIEKIIYLTLDDIYLIEEHYESSDISTPIVDYFNNHDPNPNLMYMFIIKNGNLVINKTNVSE